jgi:hypothetical protein
MVHELNDIEVAEPDPAMLRITEVIPSITSRKDKDAKLIEGLSCEALLSIRHHRHTARGAQKSKTKIDT